jgi:hypothetical protein
LLQSVYKGYPIGSLLFWNTSEIKLTVETSDRFPFPKAPLDSPVAFVLDGMQRLATLYNCFFPVDAARFPEFNVVFDLRELEFTQQGREPLTPAQLRLSWLFSPKDFLSAQRELSREPDSDVLLDRAIALHSRFQEYMIPTVTIEGRSITEVVEIFERINNTGTKLSAVDFMRAVTWSEGFDLAVETSKLGTRLEDDGFRVGQETLVKVVAIALGRDPSLDEMLRLRGTPPRELQGAIKAAEASLRGAMAFLGDEFHILSYDYVPYEAQLLVLCKLFLASEGPPSPSAKNAARRWFWATSFNEGLQGKAESVVATLLKHAEQLAAGDTKAFDVRIEIEAEDLLPRHFIAKRSAISCAMGALFASQGARSVVTGNKIAIETYMSEFSSTSYWPMLAAESLRDTVGVDALTTATFVPNVIVTSPEDRAVLRKLGGGSVAKALAKLTREQRRATLLSQAMSDATYKHLTSGDVPKFLLGRASDIVATARKALE